MVQYKLKQVSIIYMIASILFRSRPLWASFAATAPPPVATKQVQQESPSTNFDESPLSNFYRLVIRSANVTKTGRGKFTPHHLLKLVRLYNSPEQEALLFSAYFNLLGHHTQMPSLVVDRMLLKVIKLSTGDLTNFISVFNNHTYLRYFPHYRVTHALLTFIVGQSPQHLDAFIQVLLDSPLIKFDKSLLHCFFHLMKGKRLTPYKDSLTEEIDQISKWWERQGKSKRMQKYRARQKIKAKKLALVRKQRNRRIWLKKAEKIFKNKVKPQLSFEQRFEQMKFLISKRHQRRMANIKRMAEKKRKIFEMPQQQKQRRSSRIYKIRKGIKIFLGIKKTDIIFKKSKTISLLLETKAKKLFPKLKNWFNTKRREMYKKELKRKAAILHLKKMKKKALMQLNLKKQSKKVQKKRVRTKMPRQLKPVSYLDLDQPYSPTRRIKSQPMNIVSKIVKLLLQRGSMELLQEHCSKKQLINIIAQIMEYNAVKRKGLKGLKRSIRWQEIYNKMIEEHQTTIDSNDVKKNLRNKDWCNIAIMSLLFANHVDAVKAFSNVQQQKQIKRFLAFCKLIDAWNRQKVLLEFDNAILNQEQSSILTQWKNTLNQQANEEVQQNQKSEETQESEQKQKKTFIRYYPKRKRNKKK